MIHRLARLADFRVGQRASFTKTIAEEDLARFIAVTGDDNPLHTDEEFARGTFFGGRIAHGLLSASLLSTVIGTLLPGTGAIYREQTLRLLRPVRPGDTLTATAEVREIRPDTRELALATWLATGPGERVTEGEAVVALLRRK